jgi:hypothetical protein
MSHRDNDPSQARTVVFLSGDLIFASRVRAAAEKAGLQFRLSGSLPETETESIAYVVLDLSTRSTLTSEISRQCAQRCPDAQLIAYGPHVQAGKLAAAREAGIPSVLTRGQFDSKLAALFVN